jgi:hypothetical protein
MMIPEARRSHRFYAIFRRENRGFLSKPHEGTHRDTITGARAVLGPQQLRAFRKAADFSETAERWDGAADRNVRAPVTEHLTDIGSVGLLLLMLILFAAPHSARANVYATNIKINDGITNISVTAGSSVHISYILNEPASGGVLIKILEGTNTVRTISLAAGAAGTLRGKNIVTWDGNGAANSPVPTGVYGVSVRAASQGYARWTQTTDDNADGNVIWQGRGIAVDQNTNSPYYGRVFVANAQQNDLGMANWLGYGLGILKCNADASYADEGGLSTGGYPWSGDTFSPWHLEVSRNDEVFINDFTTNGQVIRWDATISTNSQVPVLRPDNWTNLDVSLSGPALSYNGTNTFLWMADATFASSQSIGLGILRYKLLPNGTCATNDTGITAVAVGGSLTGNPVDVAVDKAGNIYTIQDNPEPGDTNNRVFRFPPLTTSDTNTPPLTNADWAVGATNDTMGGASGIGVDPTGTYVAVAFAGLSTGSNGCTQIFYATNGAVVTNLDLGITIGEFSDHEDRDCAWDAVGNVYYIDNFLGVWRAVSPPGTNQATTAALPLIQVTAPPPAVPPEITKISVIGGLVVIDFTAGSNDVATAFTILAGSSVSGPYSTVTGATITNVAPGQFKATLPAGSSTQYFRISRQGTAPPPSGLQFTKIATSGNTVVLTFSGDINDPPSAFTVFGAANVNGTYSALPSATVSSVSPGVFQASVPLSGPSQFYKIKR